MDKSHVSPKQITLCHYLTNPVSCCASEMESLGCSLGEALPTELDPVKAKIFNSQLTVLHRVLPVSPSCQPFLPWGTRGTLRTSEKFWKIPLKHYHPQVSIF